MKSPGSHRSRSRRPSPPVDPATALHRYAVKLFDQGDGRAIDWPKAAEALFKVAFRCLDEAGSDDRATKVVRRVHDGAYNRLAGNPDSGLPYTPASLSHLPAGPASEMAPELDTPR